MVGGGLLKKSLVTGFVFIVAILLLQPPKYCDLMTLFFFLEFKLH